MTKTTFSGWGSAPGILVAAGQAFTGLKLRNPFGRTEGQLDVQGARLGRAEGGLYVHESRHNRAEGPLYVQMTLNGAKF